MPAETHPLFRTVERDHVQKIVVTDTSHNVVAERAPDSSRHALTQAATDGGVIGSCVIAPVVGGEVWWQAGHTIQLPVRTTARRVDLATPVRHVEPYGVRPDPNGVAALELLRDVVTGDRDGKRAATASHDTLVVLRQQLDDANRRASDLELRLERTHRDHAQEIRELQQDFDARRSQLEERLEELQDRSVRRHNEELDGIRQRYERETSELRSSHQRERMQSEEAAEMRLRRREDEISTLRNDLEMSRDKLRNEQSRAEDDRRQLQAKYVVEIRQVEDKLAKARRDLEREKDRTVRENSSVLDLMKQIQVTSDPQTRQVLTAAVAAKMGVEMPESEGDEMMIMGQFKDLFEMGRELIAAHRESTNEKRAAREERERRGRGRPSLPPTPENRGAGSTTPEAAGDGLTRVAV